MKYFAASFEDEMYKVIEVVYVVHDQTWCRVDVLKSHSTPDANPFLTRCYREEAVDDKRVLTFHRLPDTHARSANGALRQAFGFLNREWGKGRDVSNIRRSINT